MKIEELKRRCIVEITMNDEDDPINAIAKITLAAIADAQRFRKDENGNWRFLTAQRYWTDVASGNIPAAVLSVLEVTGEKE